MQATITPVSVTSKQRYEKSLSSLCERFCSVYKSREGIIGIDESATELGVQRRRMYEILNIMKSVGLISRVKTGYYKWEGVENMIQVLRSLQKSGIASTYSSCISSNTEDSEKGSKTSKANEKRKAVATCLSERFIQIFVCNEFPQPIVLEDIMSVFVQYFGDSKNPISRGRRLYDIANVLCTLGLVTKSVAVDSTTKKRKRMYEWCGPSLNEGIEKLSSSLSVSSPLLFYDKKKPIHDYPKLLSNEASVTQEATVKTTNINSKTTQKNSENCDIGIHQTFVSETSSENFVSLNKKRKIFPDNWEQHQDKCSDSRKRRRMEEVDIPSAKEICKTVKSMTDSSELSLGRLSSSPDLEIWNNFQGDDISSSCDWGEDVNSCCILEEPEREICEEDNSEGDLDEVNRSKNISGKRKHKVSSDEPQFSDGTAFVLNSESVQTVTRLKKEVNRLTHALEKAELREKDLRRRIDRQEDQIQKLVDEKLNQTRTPTIMINSPITGIVFTPYSKNKDRVNQRRGPDLPNLDDDVTSIYSTMSKSPLSPTVTPSNCLIAAAASSLLSLTPKKGFDSTNGDTSVNLPTIHNCGFNPTSQSLESISSHCPLPTPRLLSSDDTSTTTMVSKNMGTTMIQPLATGSIPQRVYQQASPHMVNQISSSSNTSSASSTSSPYVIHEHHYHHHHHHTHSSSSNGTPRSHSIPSRKLVDTPNNSRIANSSCFCSPVHVSSSTQYMFDTLSPLPNVHISDEFY